MNTTPHSGLEPGKPPAGESDSPVQAVFLFGPTAVGKTATLAALADRFPGRVEVVNADSMQVYRGMDIGTAKADEAEQAAVPHHLIDIYEPSQQFTVADFVGRAKCAIADISRRGGIPVVSGGTAFYFKHLWFGLPESPPADAAIRQELEAECLRDGLETMRRRLAEVDAVSEARIGANDQYRVLRALEVYRSCGRPLSDFAVPDRPAGDIDALVIGLSRDRAELYQRIDVRVRQMFDDGLEDEVRGLLARGLEVSAPGMKAIGYREFTKPDVLAELQAGKLSEATRECLIDEISRSSRRYAKRQVTFFTSLPDVVWVHPDEQQIIVENIAAHFNR